MQEVRRKKTTVIGLRAAAPKFGRVLALIAIFAGIVLVGVSYYRNRNNKVFRLLQRPAQLSTEVRGIVEGYERQITKGGRPHILLRASREITYTDGHHELEDVHLEVYPETGDRPNTITARRTISNEDNSLIAFTGCDGRTHDAIWWGGAEAAAATPRPGARIELAYAVEQNTWRDETRLQLIVEDMKLVNSEL